MSAWKLVEAEVDEPEQNKVEASNQSNFSNDKFQKGIKSGGRGGRGNQGGRGGRGNGGRGTYKTPYISKQDRNYRSYMAVQLIEMILSPDNLCMDTYIRSYMDEAGYVPIALVYTYPNVAAFGALYGDLKYRLKQLGEDSCVEIDPVNDLIRTKNNWEMWLMPNQTGGRGQPRYVKQTNSKQYGNNYQNNMQQQNNGYGSEGMGNMDGYMDGYMDGNMDGNMMGYINQGGIGMGMGEENGQGVAAKGTLLQEGEVSSDTTEAGSTNAP